VRKKRTEITIEITELMLVKSPRGRPAQKWCPGCAEEVAMVTPEQAAVIGEVSTRTIYRWIEEGNLHFIEGPDRSMLVCPNSLEANDRD
jgi:hypothetical protein